MKNIPEKLWRKTLLHISTIQQKPTVTNGVTFLVCTFHKHCVTSLKTAAKETNGVFNSIQHFVTNLE